MNATRQSGTTIPPSGPRRKEKYPIAGSSNLAAGVTSRGQQFNHTGFATLFTGEGYCLLAQAQRYNRGAKALDDTALAQHLNKNLSLLVSVCQGPL